MYRLVTGRERGQPLVPHFPAVTKRALEHGFAPKLIEPSDVRRAISHTGGQQHPARGDLITTFQFEYKPVVVANAVHDASVAEFHTGIGRQLAATRRIQLGGSSLIVTQQPAHHGSCRIAGFPRVDDEGAPACSSQHQRTAQARRAATDDHTFPFAHRACFADARRSKRLAVVFYPAGGIAYRGPDLADLPGVESAERCRGDRHRHHPVGVPHRHRDRRDLMVGGAVEFGG